MGKIIGKTRNQCRSFNQRMKNHYYKEGIYDIPEIVEQNMSKLIEENHEKREEIQ